MALVDAYLASVKPLCQEDRDRICIQTAGQASNKSWYTARIGRLTASLFKRICRCIKPEGLLKTLLYPSGRAVSEALVYGRVHEKDAVDAYVAILRHRDSTVEVLETGLHVHNKYPFVAASPDRIVTVNGEEGLLEVKCPFSKRGLTIEEACADRAFCSIFQDGEAILKRDHHYFYQVQGQMAVTGHKWCDLVLWVESGNPTEPHQINAERIDFDLNFWEQEILPGLLHFMRHALVPELLTKRLKRLGKLYTCGQYVSHKMLQRGFYVCEPRDDLLVKIRKLK
ncbi:uncharacterized protein LOC119374915 [Rhipicephalus sanguineus]|uniref:uncharacterized protein LOC119374915 n=1 Tax=Rhipicephalus sanguineus TaxID=34632 RepID=UPI001893E617|nr:uncharacterized protein LOC119374915 [Rhipicephalus sanguineus]